MTTEPGSLAIDDLCGFAARINPRRAFLFVSKVLGRHIPVRPRAMREAHLELARRLPPHLPGPILFFGFAETAIALGYGVFREYMHLHQRRDGSYLHSTRYRFKRPLLARFREEHSHATEHLIYGPANPTDMTRLLNARSLVLVDDELTTGNTLANAATVLKQSLPHLRDIAGAVLTDWGGGRIRVSQFPVVSLLQGGFVFEPKQSRSKVSMPDVRSKSAYRDPDLPRNDGRFALKAELDISPYLPLFEGGDDAEIAIVGTGEFVTVPFLVAEALERRGVSAWCQATTRSPVMISNAIHSKQTFDDFHGDGITNFIYNLDGPMYDKIFLCAEYCPVSGIKKRLGNLSIIPVDFT